MKKHATNLKSKTVLVVDDDQDFVAQQEAVLKAAGCNVITADNREAAEKAIREIKYDAIIMDLMIDESDDGFVLCHIAKTLHPDRPIVMVTGVVAETGMEFDAATSEEREWIKADVLLNKPIRAEQLLKELTRLLKE